MNFETLENAPVLAAIDMGSNSFRLEMARMVNGRYQRTMDVKETVRLGGGLNAASNLTEVSMRRGLACLSRFARQLQGIDPRHVRAVATQTLREARNRDTFLARAQNALAHPIEVISGREEARLIFAGVAHLQPGTRDRLVIDVGGRSTEMILGTGLQARVVESFAVGSVGLSLRYFADGKLTAKAFREAQIAAGAELEEALGMFGPSHWQEALGSSGTVGAVSQLLQASGQSDGTITPAALRWCIQQCIHADHIDKLELPGLREDRRPVVAGGLSLLYTLCMHFGIKRLAPSKGALRQGVIIELHQRLLAQRRRTGAGSTPARHGQRARPSTAKAVDVRDRTVLDLLTRFAANARQARRVRTAALALHAYLAPTEAQQQALGWAAMLHEVGHMVSHHDHHRHSAYLLAHVDAAGFSQTDQRHLSALVLAQRGGLRKVEHLLPQHGTVGQMMSLRLAVILCHARTDAPLQGLRLSTHNRHATLSVDRAWADAHPRTLHLLREEAALWARDTEHRLSIEAPRVNA